MYGGGVTGGSSSESYGTGGYGGTQTGVSSSSWQTTSQSTSTTTQAGAYSGFGFGGNGIYYSSGYGGAGGGGWYGGSGTYPDSSNDDDKGGGGGSGYVYTSSTASNYPSGCLLNSQYYLENATTLAGNTAFTSPTGVSETGHTGDGYIRITVIEAQGGNTLIKVPQTLPSTYTQLDYLQFTGAQYINTGVIVDGNTGFDITFEVLNGQSSSPYYNLFGVRGNDSSGGSSENQNFFRIDTIPVDSSSGTEFKYASTVYNSGITGTSKINIKLLNKVYTKPDESTITVSGDITSGLAMYIGCINKDNTAYGNKASMKLYRFKIYNSSTLTHDYIPVQRVSDKVLGLYDLTTSTFKTNAASGIPFTSNLMNDSASLIYFNGDSLSSQGNESLTITNNNVTLSSEQTHFNKNSLKFDGSSSYMYMPFPSTYAGDITIEGWFYQTSNNNSSYPTPFTLISSAGRGFYMHRLSNQTFVAATASNSWPGLSGGTTTLNTWTHIAMCLSSAATTTYCFIDGKLMGTLADTNTSYVGLTLGTLASSTSDNHSSGCYFQGYISELKVTKGCKWTKDFTLPTKPYETSNNSPWKNAKQIFVNTGASSTIPSGLVELEYIQSSGTQYINTGIIPDGNTRVECKFVPLDTGTQAIFCGGRTAVSGTNAYTNTMFYIGQAIRRDYFGASKTSTSTYASGTTMTIDANKNAVTINDSTTEITNFTLSSATGQMPILLLCSAIYNTSTSTITNLNNYAKFKVYYYKIYNNGTLVRDLIPAKRLKDNICGLWDKVNYKFYTDENGNNFTAGSEKSAIASPGTAIEYIESSGTQYINTNILGQDISKVNVDFQFTSVPSGAEAQIAAIYVSSTVYFQIGWSGSSFMRTSEYTYSQTANSLARTQAEGTPTGQPNYTLWLFGQNETGTLKHPASAKIYSCKIYDNNNTLVRDFIPIKTTTNIYGLWDKVNKVFYSNVGTGTFTGGSTVTLSGWHLAKTMWVKTTSDAWTQVL